MSRTSACRGSAPTRQSGDQVLAIAAMQPGTRRTDQTISLLLGAPTPPRLRSPELPLAEGGSQRRLPRNRVTASVPQTAGAVPHLALHVLSAHLLAIARKANDAQQPDDRGCPDRG